MVALVLDGLVGFPAGLSPTSFHLSPSSFHLSPRLDCGRGLWSGSRLACLPLPFICLPLLFIVSQAGCLWSGSRPACLPLPSFVSHFFSLVSQAGCLWSGSRLACLPLPFICLPGSVLVVGFPAGLSPTSFHLSPTSFQAGRFWSGSRLACLPLPFVCLPLLFICLPLLFICLPGWVLVVGFPAGLSPTSFHVSPTFSPSSLLLGFSILS